MPSAERSENEQLAVKRGFEDKKVLKNSGLNGDWNPDLCDAGALLHQLSYQANWEQVVMWVKL